MMEKISILDFSRTGVPVLEHGTRVNRQELCQEDINGNDKFQKQIDIYQKEKEKAAQRERNWTSLTALNKLAQSPPDLFNNSQKEFRTSSIEEDSVNEEIGDGMEYMELLKIVIHFKC